MGTANRTRPKCAWQKAEKPKHIRIMETIKEKKMGKEIQNKVKDRRSIV